MLIRHRAPLNAKASAEIEDMVSLARERLHEIGYIRPISHEVDPTLEYATVTLDETELVHFKDAGLVISLMLALSLINSRSVPGYANQVELPRDLLEELGEAD